jgi:hypothetical protein
LVIVGMQDAAFVGNDEIRDGRHHALAGKRPWATEKHYGSILIRSPEEETGPACGILGRFLEAGQQHWPTWKANLPLDHQKTSCRETLGAWFWKQPGYICC